MTEESSSTQGNIVPAGSSKLAVQKVLRRGIADFRRDLLRLKPWKIKRVFTQHHDSLAVSPTGQVAASGERNHRLSQLIELYDVEIPGMPSTLRVRPARNDRFAYPADSFAWSPSGRYLVTSSVPDGCLRLYDVHARRFLECFGKQEEAAYHLAWSRSSRFLVTASGGFDKRSLKLWACKRPGDFAAQELEPVAPAEPVVGISPAAEITSVGVDDELSFDENDECEGLFGFGCCDFSPDDQFVATVAIVRTAWSHLSRYRLDDWIFILDVPTLQEQVSFEISGQATDVSWAADNGNLICCCLGGQTYLVDKSSGEPSPLPYEADMCRCHPTQNLCGFALGRGNHYMRNYDDYFAELHQKGDKHRIYVADLSNGSVIDERRGSGAVVDMRWSSDGSRLYAVTEDGLAYVYNLN